MTRPALSVALVLASVLVMPAAAERPRGSITIERIANIKYPTSPAWSPDGQRVAFLWDAAGKQDVFVVTPGQAAIALTDFTVDPHLLQSDVGQLAWMSNDELLFGKDGQLWSVSVTTRQPRRYDGLSDAASFTLSPDRRQIAFLRQGQIWIGSLAAKTQRKLTNIAAPLSASVPVFSSDGRWLAFTAAHNSLETEDLPWNGTLVRSVANATADRRLGITAAQGGDVAWVPTIGNVTGVQWTAHGSIVYQEQSPDGKTREIKTAAVGTLPRVLWRDYDEKWWSPTNRDSRLVVSRDGKMLAFVSDRTGWIHVYVIPTDATSESQARQLTTGDFGAGLPAWSPDGSRIAYHHSVKNNQMERFISIVDLKSGAHQQVVTERGVNLDPAFSPDGSRLLFQRTDVHNSLDLFVTGASARQPGSDTLLRLSNSMPAGLNTADFAVPTPVYFPSRLDGKQVPATLDGGQDPRSHTQAPGDRVDSWIRLGSELSRVASGQLSHVLLGEPVSRATGVCRHHTGLPREFRLQPRLGHWRAHGAGHQRCDRRCIERGLLEDTGLRRSGSHRRVGPQLRRLSHAASADARSIAVPLWHQRGWCRRLGDATARVTPRRGLARRSRIPRSTECLRRFITSTHSRARCWSCTAPMIATSHSAIRCVCGISCSSSGRTSKWVSIQAKFISSAARTFSATPGDGQKTSSIGI